MTQARTEDLPDVRILASQDLAEERFPGGRNDPFRVFLSPDVHAAIWKHATETTEVEICGVLVGTWLRDDAGPFVKVTESIRGEGAETKFAEVTFTHQTWSKINAEMDSKFGHLQIVGWYHTHPDFGIFLSDRDLFIQQHFFSGPGQIALVVDPVRKIEGVFAWRDGKAALTGHYWVGDRLMVGADGRDARDDRARPAAMRDARQAAAGAEAAARPAEGSLFSGISGLLLAILLLLLGYLLGGLRSGWERQAIIEGTVAHYGIWNGLRPGLSTDLERLGQDMAAAVRPLGSLSPEKEPDRKALAEARERLVALVGRTAEMRVKYGLSADEEAALRRLVVDRIAEVSAGRAAPAEAPREATPPPAASSKTDASPSPGGDKAAEKDRALPGGARP
ncbi:Mov34/MPN/PAD-1 family protein [Aquisphaera giovannonii]|uniref:Mov34/MPN/PAD-1 family protein n=1 Tax=Aquisphaera giovannonii TaxID=406548 RepID=A0A5B9W0M0_9BACT|nr:Mov34/MPN/PAD-1 family protein [Aquisphaera giovannonii]QEH34192.1 Mov34/MPN/PAD-1 family protein [Aquisphaera giovannonii]